MITITNPWSGASVECDEAEFSQADTDLFVTRLSDDEAYQCEGGDTPGEWVAHMVEQLGDKRAGAVILS